MFLVVQDQDFSLTHSNFFFHDGTIRRTEVLLILLFDDIVFSGVFLTLDHQTGLVPFRIFGGVGGRPYSRNNHPRLRDSLQLVCFGVGHHYGGVHHLVYSL